MAQEWSAVAGCINQDVATLKCLEVVFSNILNVVFVLAGLVLFVMLISGGLSYLTSGGDQEKLKKAGGILTNAVVGLILLIGSWFILKFIKQFTGVDVTKFEIPGTSQ